MVTSKSDSVLTNRPQKRVAFHIRGVSLPVLALVLILLFGAFLRFYNLGAIGDAKTYYTVATKSMLMSWHNFFFIAAEPGGSVSVDKPPLGFWLQAISAFFLGVNGFAVALPQIVAGLLSISILYHMVKKHFGSAAGLLAALTLAITPIAIVTERDNIIDGTLVFFLILAAWAFNRAADSGRLRYLWLGAVLVGLAFNVKMLEAFLPLPAFYALYLLGAQKPWSHKAVQLGAATLILLAVSLSWAAVVDLTPPDQRPYVGSSSNNTEIDLIFGYNGLGRLFGSTSSQKSAGTLTSQLTTLEAGPPGPFRLFSQPLAKEVSWLLPFALLGTAFLIFRERLRFPLGATHRAVILWGGWLLAGVVSFSMAKYFHRYYLIVLGPPIAALLGITAQSLWRLFGERRGLAVLLIALFAAATVGFQWYTIGHYAKQGVWMPVAALLILIGVIGLVVINQRTDRLAWPGKSVVALIMAGLLLTPGLWSAMSTFDKHPNSLFPATYSGSPDIFGGMSDEVLGNYQAVIDYLQPRTANIKYLLAVGSAATADSYILKTGRPVLMMGGFTGSDNVVTVEQLAQLIKNNQLRYIQDSSLTGVKPQISAWLKANCKVISQNELSASSGTSAQGGSPSGLMKHSTLYDCGN